MSTFNAARNYISGLPAELPFELPKRIRIQEVGPRDGFQLEANPIATADKVAIIDALSRTGLPAVQLTSFVRPEAIPQLSDAEDVMAGYTPAPGVEYSVLVPNLKGAERALAWEAHVWELMLSATDAHSLVNANQTTADAFEKLRPVIDLALKTGVTPVGGIATALGCPFEGRTPFDRLVQVIERYVDANVRRITLADTAGLADPGHVYAVCSRLRSLFPEVTIGLHLHNTRGMAMANVLAGLAAGIESFDSSIGGLGGCPYAPGATGNIATEELVHMLALLGIETGVEIDALLRVARNQVAKVVNHPLESAFQRADPSWKLFDFPPSGPSAELTRTSSATVGGV